MVQEVFWSAGLVLSGILVIRLAATRLYRIYPYFFAFLSFQILRTLVLLPLQPNTYKYALIFLVTQPVTWLLYILVVLELYSLALREHKGIASVSRWVLSGGLAVSVLVSALTLRADLSRVAVRNKLLIYYSVVERGLVFSLVIFLLLITVFLLWFPVSVRRNVVLHAAVYSAYFISSTFALLVRNVAGYQTNRAVNMVLLFVDLMCLTLWIAGLNRHGEEHPVVVRRKWSPEDEALLVQKLDALNSALIRRPPE